MQRNKLIICGIKDLNEHVIYYRSKLLCQEIVNWIIFDSDTLTETEELWLIRATGSVVMEGLQFYRDIGNLL